MHALNLLTSNARRRQIVTVRLRQWTAIIAASLILLAGWATWLWYRGQAMSTYRQALEARYEPMSELQADLVDLRQEINRLSEREHFTLSLAKSRPPITLLGTIAQATSTIDTGILISQFELESAVDGTAQLKLGGLGRSSLDVAKFLASLRNTELLRDQEPTRTESVASSEGHTFQISFPL
jgi:Tfp pilus assembly protein PilN